MVKFARKDEVKSFTLAPGVRGRVIFSSDKMMFLLVEIEPGYVVPEHSHPHEQMGLCLRGRALFRSGEEKKIVEEGTFYWIPPGEKHEVTSLTDDVSIFLDVFSPPRIEYLKKSEIES